MIYFINNKYNILHPEATNQLEFNRYVAGSEHFYLCLFLFDAQSPERAILETDELQKAEGGDHYFVGKS